MTDEERRAEDEAQPLALSTAEESHALPDEDRRHAEIVEPEIQADAGALIHKDNAHPNNSPRVD